jgi:hypothetical protein
MDLWTVLCPVFRLRGSRAYHFVERLKKVNLSPVFRVLTNTVGCSP